MALINRRLKETPDNVFLRALLIDVHLTAGEYKAGINVCEALLREETVLQDEELHFQVVSKLAECADRMGDLDKATTFYLRAIDLKPHQPDVRRRFGFLLLTRSESTADPNQRQQVLGEAEQVFSQQIEQERNKPIKEQDVEVFYGRALARMRLRKVEEAMLDLNEALAVDDKFPPVHHKLGECYQSLKRNHEAVAHFDIFVDNHQEYYKSMASHDRQVVSSEYILSDVLLRRARCLIEMEKYALATVDLDTILSLAVDPFINVALCLRGHLHLRQRRFQQAVDDATQSLTVCGTFIPALALRAEAYSALGKQEEASKDMAALASLMEQPK